MFCLNKVARIVLSMLGVVLFAIASGHAHAQTTPHYNLVITVPRSPDACSCPPSSQTIIAGNVAAAKGWKYNGGTCNPGDTCTYSIPRPPDSTYYCSFLIPDNKCLDSVSFWAYDGSTGALVTCNAMGYCPSTGTSYNTMPVAFPHYTMTGC